jgi:NADH-quinone oxidoreductase subunit G
VINRGAHEEIDVMPGFPLDNKLSGNVVDLCPVGALGDKDFLYRQRVWFLRRHPGVCTGCATGCAIWIEENQDHVYRLKPRVNMEVNQWWMCNEGRYGCRHVHDPRRLVRPQRREHGATLELDWTTLPAELRERLRGAGRLAGVLSPYLSVEEAYLLAKFLRAIDPQALLALGPSPTGLEEQFPKGFVIAADRAPNRRGVEEVLAHFTRRVVTFEQFLPELARGGIRAAWVTGGYKGDWIDDDAAA